MTLGQYELLGRLGARVQGTPNGKEPPVVLLHGLTYDHRQWDALIDELTAREPHRLIVAFDLPGHGRSPDAESCLPADVALSLHRSLDALGAAAPIIVGHSYGAVVATAYAAVHPAAGVVNVDQPLLAGSFAKRLRELEPLLRSPQWREVWDEQLAAMGIDALPPRARDLVRTATAPRQELLLAYWQELLEESTEELARRRTWQLRAIRHADVAYTHVAGRDVPPLYAQWLTALLPKARIITCPGSGHFPHLLHPAVIADLLTV
ncbi:alpha/beta fold hydrolase [Streptomyces sp. enrichment culture]|uniref:alpha/beta fold hydrolase n=1 Tax=Streptomyces sp. enrichment culture TaxID=1795815 RepID=UPI003F55669F